MARKKGRPRRRAATKRKPAKRTATEKTGRRRAASRKPAKKARQRKTGKTRRGGSGRAARARRPGEDLLGPPAAETRLIRDERERIAARTVGGEPGTNPTLTGGDVDADWRRAASVGEEAVGGSVATPDQDVVDDLGDALGVPRAPDESFRPSGEILEARDARRSRQEG